MLGESLATITIMGFGILFVMAEARLRKWKEGK